MLVERTKIKETNHFKVGDIIRFSLNDGEEVKAMAVKKCNTVNKGMLFVTVDCINKRKRMFDKDLGEEMSYHNSDLRKFLNNELFLKFPKEIQDLMLPVYALDKIRILSEIEIFGENKYGREEDELGGKHWEIMEEERNQISLESYWIMNRIKEKDTKYFNCVCPPDISSALCGYAYYSSSFGVRPVFRLLNEKIGNETKN